jgi:ABC-2 type transport system ATP-binding protein
MDACPAIRVRRCQARLHPFFTRPVSTGVNAIDTPAIEALGLRKSYRGGKDVLRGVSFAVEPGTIFAYLGRNGAGKSTTVRILATLTLPTGGSARVQGLDVRTDAQEVRRRIGVTMQDAALDEYATARQHLELSGRLWGFSARDARSRAAELLDQFGLEEAADTRIAQLSGGTQRRVDIATALIGHPRVLFLDEPTTGLDPQSRRALWRELEELRDAGAAILLTTQSMDEAEELADTVAVLDRGSLVAVDTPKRLVAKTSREVVDLRVTDPSQRDQVRLAADGTAIVSTPGGNGAVRVELPSGRNSDGAVALLSRLQKLAIPVDSVRVSQPSLEDAFLRLTGSSINGAEASR